MAEAEYTASPTYAPSEALSRYTRMVARDAIRDGRMATVREVRQGNMRALFPEHLSQQLGHEGLAIANFIDVVARDLAEVIAPLPSLSCASGKMETAADKKRAGRKNRIGEGYWRKSDLEVSMLWGADQYITYGFLPFFIEPDMDRKTPVIQPIDPYHSHYELNRWGDTTVFAHKTYYTCDELCSLYPEYSYQLRVEGVDSKGAPKICSGDTLLEMVQWVDGQSVTLFVPQRAGLVLGSYLHGQSKCPVRIAVRPGLDHNKPRGQFDDALYVQLARAILAGLRLDAAQQAVDAPIAVPNDVIELPTGPGAVIQSDNAQAIHRVQLEVPTSLFQQDAQLENEMQVGTRYPDARLGQANASVITGRGIQELMGGFDTQIKAAQMILKRAFEHLTSQCFEMDEKLWPNARKILRGTLSGVSYEMTYTPKLDIAGNYECEVTYGFLSGMAPQAATVLMLQLQGAGVLGVDTFRDNLGFDMDNVQEQRSINVAVLRDALKQGIASMGQAIGQMAANEQDPMPIVTAMVSIIQGVVGGAEVEDATASAFTAMAQAQQQAAAAAQAAQASQAADANAGVPGAGPPGGPPAPDDGSGGGPQLPQQPSALPAIQSMIAGFRNGKAVDDETVRRQPLASS